MLIVIVVLAAMLPATVLAEAPAKAIPLPQAKFMYGLEPWAVYPSDDDPDDPFLTQSPGDTLEFTYYDMQCLGSPGNRVVVCEDGSKYVTWMALPGWPYPPAPRGVAYCWIGPNGEIECGSLGNGGFPHIDVIYGDRFAIVYHGSAVGIALAINTDPPGYYDPPDSLPPYPGSPGRMYWPYIAVDRNNRIHIVATENTDRRQMRLGYTRSTDGGPTWSEPAVVDTVMNLSSVIDASPVSDRVAIAYSHPLDTTSQWQNDVIYIVSDDGLEWDFTEKINITDGDSLSAGTDLDIIFDYDDYIHVVWNAFWITDEGIDSRTFLLHYDEETGAIDTILVHGESDWPYISGGWNLPICKMNLGVDSSNTLYVTWTQFDTSDVSAGGFGNGELYMSYSPAIGVWSAPINLTNSPTPGCYPGNCDSDHWSTLADVVNDTLHLTYINDKDAGAVIMTEGTATDNPVLYHAYATLTGIQDDVVQPRTFSLAQNYPNPFNSETVISYSVARPCHVRLEVFDILGCKVATLVDERQPAGKHEMTWDAEGQASGVYVYRLQAGDFVQARRMVVVK